jgi:hypothetical protein
MDPSTGKIIEVEDKSIKKFKKTRHGPEYSVPVIRDLSGKEKRDLQIKLYSPCACNSGKKFKFCCKNEEKEDKNE